METTELREKMNSHFKIHVIIWVNDIIWSKGFIGFSKLTVLLTKVEIKYLLEKAMKCEKDKLKKKYRRGLTVTLYSK